MAITKLIRAAALLLAASPAPVLADGHEHAALAWGARAEADGLSGDPADARWEARLWLGGDNSRLLLRSEGAHADGHTQAGTWALLSRRLDSFWDVQAGLRADSGPDGGHYAVLGIEGLAPYFFDSEAHVFVDGDGDISLRLHQSVDVLLTRKLVLQPRLELGAGLRQGRDPAQDTGLRDSEAGLRLRYELRREFAPYVEWWRERHHGGTADLLRTRGEATGDSGLRLGVMLRF